MLFVLVVQSLLRGGDLHFEKHVINDKLDYSAAALIDVNHDAKLDVVCGGDWYEAPNWNRHAAADVPRIGGRPDGFSHLAFDVNRDGWTDVITVNYRSRSIKWMEHPGRANEPWKLHIVVEPGPMESGRLVDIDGDGQLDLLPNGRDFAAWWEFRWKDKAKKNTPVWIRHELPAEARGHGVGFGDINGDGRGDIVGQSGWLQSPNDARAGKWLWHPEYKIERGSVPMLVVDPDEDGDHDIVWCSAHGFGVYWLEQTQDTGTRRWKRHAIDTSWSQGHAPLWADMDGDGRHELIAGKRYMSHGGSDPGAFDPLVVYRYQFNLATQTWDRWIVSSGERVGLGLDPKVGDIDNDGDLDLLACGRSGLYWLENKGSGTTKASFAEPAIDKREAWGRHRSRIVAAISQSLGGLPSCKQRVKLNVSIESRVSEALYELRRIRFAIDGERTATAKLFVPTKAKRAGTSGVVCVFEPDSQETANSTARRLASHGYVCIVPNLMKSKSNSLIDSVWQCMRAADVLQGTSAVHGERIAFIGDARAGMLGLHVAAIDQRFIATSVDASRALNEIIGGSSEYHLAELISVVAPRGLRVSLPRQSDFASNWQTQAEKAAKTYELLNVAGRLSFQSFSEADNERGIDWLQRELPASP